jgi:methylated-DNA-[protein]-cysteine S-methyltransferase
MDEKELKQLMEKAYVVPDDAVKQCREQVQAWFVETAPLVRWDVIESPVGALYFAASEKGLCRLEFGVDDQEAFIATLDPLARTERDPEALAQVATQMQEYFAGERSHFDIPLDLSALTPFHRTVLEMAYTVPYGSKWTYGQLARAIGKPKASRAVGHALGRNPLMIIVPCHRIVASDGNLRGYRAGISFKRMLLQLEGAL